MPSTICSWTRSSTPIDALGRCSMSTNSSSRMRRKNVVFPTPGSPRRMTLYSGVLSSIFRTFFCAISLETKYLKMRSAPPSNKVIAKIDFTFAIAQVILIMQYCARASHVTSILAGLLLIQLLSYRQLAINLLRKERLLRVDLWYDGYTRFQPRANLQGCAARRAGSREDLVVPAGKGQHL